MPSQRLPSLSTPRSRLPVGKPLRSSGMAYSVCLPVFGSSLPRNCSPKFVYQTVAVHHDHVVRLDGRARQIVFGDDDVGAAALHARQGLELVLMLRGRAQIDAGEVLRHLAEALGIGGARLIHAPLRLDRLAHLRIAVHARDHLHELVGVVGRLHDPFERVAAHAIDELELVVVAAGHAHHPFGIGELLAQVPGLAQLEIGGGGRARGDVGALGAVEVVADRANLQAVMSGLEPGGREAVAALRVGDDADRDGRAVLPALTITPSIGPSSAEVTCPASVAAL